MKETTINLKGLCCADCARKIEEGVAKSPGVEEAYINFINQQIHIKFENIEKEEMLKNVIKIADSIESGLNIFPEKDIEDDHHDDHDHDHDHDHDDDHGHGHAHGGAFVFDKAMKLKFARFSVGLVIYFLCIFNVFTGDAQLGMFIVAYFLFGYDILMVAIKNIFHGRVFDENFLMSISTIGAFAIGEYSEAVAVMMFFQVGEFLQDMAVERSRRSIKGLIDIKAEYANLLGEGDEITKVDPVKVKIGEIVLVKPGEKIPLDGVVIEGKSLIDASSLIGESVPRSINVGDNVLSGSLNCDGILKIKVTKDYKNSTVAKILDLVEHAYAKKAPTERFITKFSRYYTPIVVFSAIALAFIPPLITPQADLSEWVSRALVFLVVSCPCALVVSVPLTFFSGIGAASKKGILIKGGNYLQLLSEIDTVVFDKTGTITKGEFKVSTIMAADGVSQETLLSTANAMEKLSNHPIARSITSYCEENISGLKIEEVTDMVDVAGKGLKAKINGQEVLAGNAKLMDENGIKHESFTGIGTVVYVSKDGEYLGYIVIADSIKEDSKAAVSRLKEIGINNILMLTGDRKESAGKIAEAVGISQVYSDLLPFEKVEIVEEVYNKKPDSKVIFVGDGINDAPVLARSDVGFAMGGVGSDAAIEAADVVIMDDNLMKLSMAITIARNTMKLVKQNVGFALFVKFSVLGLAVFGLSNLWMAVFADVGVTLLVVLNSMRKK